MKIVVLDGFTLNPGDLDWAPLEKLADVEFYDLTPPMHTIERARDADILILNKTAIDKSILAELPKLKCICVSATGYNVVDVAAASDRNIPVCNVKGYSTPSVAQHVFAFILEFCNHTNLHIESVKKGDWQNNQFWSYHERPIIELAGKTMGILGYGRIGQQVATIAKAFGMQVIATNRSGKKSKEDTTSLVDQNQLFTEADFLSLHTPLTASTQGIINKNSLSRMKQNALLINTGRGDLIVEKDLKEALETGQIAGAALDVLSIEPPTNGNILIGTKNCWITPHQAWASKASRQRLLDAVVENIQSFLDGKAKNVVNE